MHLDRKAWRTEGRTNGRASDRRTTPKQYPPPPEIFRRGIIIKMLWSLTMSWKNNNIFANDTCMAIYKFNIETYKFLYLTKYSSTSSWSASSSCNTSRPMCQPHKRKCATLYMRERQIDLLQNLLHATFSVWYKRFYYIHCDSIITPSYITQTPL
mgnify:CR=1 FL=1